MSAEQKRMAAELDAILERVDEAWPAADRERAVLTASSILELHARAALGADVDKALQLEAATMANIKAAGARDARFVVRSLIERMMDAARNTVVRAIAS